MKLFNEKEESAYLSKDQWRKVFMAMSIITILLYIVAMVFSLLGSHYFILNYQNEQMDRIESFMRSHSIMGLITCIFITLEFYIVACFVSKRRLAWEYPAAFYAIRVTLAFFTKFSSTLNLLYPLPFYLIIPLVHSIYAKEKITFKQYSKYLIRLLIAIAVVFLLQLMIYVIKAGYFSVENHVLPLSGYFIYSLEYDIALFVILFTISLYINREKGDSKQWTKSQVPGSSSQTTKTNSVQFSSTQMKMTLTKTQRTKLTLFWIQFYLVQILGFLLLMVLPFIMGKVLEFLVMYLSFAIIRYLLGFKYSLHYKKESVCITVGAIVFGILTLAVPFFYVIIVVAILYGVGLGVLLHLSYKYKGMWLFTQVSKPDKFALLYVFFDGDLEDRKIRNKCKFKGLDPFQVDLISDFMKGEKLSYLAHKNNYSQRMLIYKLDEAIEKLTK